MVVKKILIPLILVIVFSLGVNAYQLDVNQEIYYPGDNIQIKVNLFNPYNKAIIVDLDSLISSESGKYSLGMMHNQVTVEPMANKEVILYDYEVSNQLEPGVYFVGVTVLSQMMQKERLGATFEVKGTLDELELDTSLTKITSRGLASTTNTKKPTLEKVYYLNDKVELATPDADAQVTASIMYPDQTTTDVTLPYTITCTQMGSYQITIIAQKEGYKPSKIVEQFAVIAKPVIITPLSCGNSVCDKIETNDNCPSDCSISATVGRAFSFNAIASNGLFLAPIAIIVLLGFAVWFVLSKKKTNKKKRRKKT